MTIHDEVEALHLECPGNLDVVDLRLNEELGLGKIGG